MTASWPLWAALGMGLLGGLHCAGMCGPLVIAGSMKEGRLQPSSLLGYLGGRLASYSMVGALVGHLGAHALCRLPVAWAQGVAVALVAALAAGRGIRLWRGSRRMFGTASAPQRWWVGWISALVPRRGIGLGLATGVLPCSMLLSAWVLAASSGGAAPGAATMAAFFAGSTPGLLLPLATARLFHRRPLRLSPALQGAGWLLLAAWVALRPLLAATHIH